MAQGRAENSATWSASPCPLPPVTHLGGCPTLGPQPARVAPHPARATSARGDAPTGPGSRLRGSHFPRPAPRPPPPSLTGRSRAAISPSPAVRSAAARGLPGVRSRPGAGGEEEGDRAQAAASAAPSRLLVPVRGCSTRPQARGGPLTSASPGSRRRRQSRPQATVRATATAETLWPGLRRAGAAPARRSAGGAAAPARPRPPQAPPHRPRPARPRRHPRAGPRAPAARPRGRSWESEVRGRARGPSPRVVLPQSPGPRPISEGHGRAGESEAAQPVQILTEGLPSAGRPCGKQSGSQNAVGAHRKHCTEEREKWSAVLVSSVIYTEIYTKTSLCALCVLGG